MMIYSGELNLMRKFEIDYVPYPRINKMVFSAFTGTSEIVYEMYYTESK
jgi:hypothetical protein